ncbi:hypothetical protein B0T17DRAFT_613158 [Bombardia bombarda]|uniref:Uncharacterized protein n=1 Tax=Bombardia bombarda TaxID=252184 RepID=A0AA40CGG3_9PEZI|nr:hypothetical protein B0T17DRAFT_613158 [Bombardia bombarda]
MSSTTYSSPRRSGINRDAGGRYCSHRGKGSTALRDVFRKYYPTSANRPYRMGSTMHDSEAHPGDLTFVLLNTDNQRHWASHKILYIKSRLELLPEFVEKQTIMDARAKQLQEVGDAAHLTENIKLRRYNLEDGPDLEVYGEDGNDMGMVVPDERVGKYDDDSNYPEVELVDIPALKYQPSEHMPVDVYTTHGSGDDFFELDGSYTVETIELLAKNSVDLNVKMHKNRWNARMGFDWVVVKMKKVVLEDTEGTSMNDGKKEGEKDVSGVETSDRETVVCAETSKGSEQPEAKVDEAIIPTGDMHAMDIERD